MQALGERLQTALVQIDGRLADPNDLPFNPEYIEIPEELEQAIDDLLARKPRLAARHVMGDIGAGARGASTATNFDLIEELRAL